MTHPWQTPPTGPRAALGARIAAPLPRIETARLVLRAPVIGDYETYAAIFLSDRWPHGAAATDGDCWVDFCQMVAGWLLRGTGVLTVTDRIDGTVLGFVLINHEFGDAKEELGWMLTAAAEGRGIATEAAAAMRDWAADALGLTGLVSYIAPENARSIALAERLGARPDGTEQGCHVYRHPSGKATT